MWIFWNLDTEEINITKINIIPLNIVFHIATQTRVWILKICNVVIRCSIKQHPPRPGPGIRPNLWRTLEANDWRHQGHDQSSLFPRSPIPWEKRVRIGNFIPSELSSFPLLSNGQNWGCQPFLRQCPNGLSHTQNQPIWWIFVTFNS